MLPLARIASGLLALSDGAKPLLAPQRHNNPPTLTLGISSPNNMKVLIKTSSPVYMRRMVRALNVCEHGFYVAGAIVGMAYNPRCNKARFTKGVLEVVEMGSGNLHSVLPSKVEHAFHDHNGRNVCASQHA